jgi:uncharacterized membrane protein YccF (DUF307 family)
MTTSNILKLILCLLFIFGGVTVLCLGHTVAGIAIALIGIGIAATTYKK